MIILRLTILAGLATVLSAGDAAEDHVKIRVLKNSATTSGKSKTSASARSSKKNNGKKSEEEKKSRPVDPPQGAESLLPLFGRCFLSTDEDYSYKLCPFANVTQREKGKKGNDKNTFLLGIWGYWKKGNSDSLEQIYVGGDSCGAVNRTTAVRFDCSPRGKAHPDFELTDISEPSPCNYSINFQLPIPCHALFSGESDDTEVSAHGETQTSRSTNPEMSYSNASLPLPEKMACDSQGNGDSCDSGERRGLMMPWRRRGRPVSEMEADDLDDGDLITAIRELKEEIRELRNEHARLKS